MNERKRKMSKERIEEALELCRMLDEDIAVADWFGCSEDIVSYITNSRIFLKDLIHDLRLADVEIERLRRIEKREAEHDCFKWLDGWIELYESDGPADGKAQGFIDWVNQQPMSGGG
ncbi:hypothetical protein LCGC14_0485980 [marine sediment metagenome]|uniref:Uncharacterized protein n=1 Tax=marine sediment metagenome TaxID=412755 RepID=A0A0F9UV48_9ZZZZ